MAWKRPLEQMFPVLEGHAITHRWGGLMGVPTSWRPSVAFDRAAGFGTAGGYVGEGVGASNLAGRIMADLVLGRDSDITHLPWVDDASERWPYEPWRWLGASAMAFLGNQADRVELTQGRRSRFWGSLFAGVGAPHFMIDGGHASGRGGYRPRAGQGPH